MFSKALQDALDETLDKGEKAVLLLNQRGFAQFLLAATAASCLNANPVRLRSPITKRAIGSFVITVVMRSPLPLPAPIVDRLT